MKEKMIAIANYIGADAESVSHEYDNVFSVGGVEYGVVNEEERRGEIYEYIKESLWAFKPGFLEDMTDIPLEVFESMVTVKSEDANDVFLNLVDKTCGLDAFIETAIQLDGYGHFLATYDGEEIELENGYYAYRL